MKQVVSGGVVVKENLSWDTLSGDKLTIVKL